MTRKEYELLASAFCESRPSVLSPKYTQWERDIISVAKSLEKDNPRFSLVKFLKACVKI